MGKFIAAGFGVGLLTAAVVWLLLLLYTPKYPDLVVVANDLPDSLRIPENAAGVASAVAVEEWATGGGTRAKLSAGHNDTAERDSWRMKLDSNASGTVLYFAAHAGSDGKKGAYLWQPPTGGAVSDADKLYFADILQRLAELPKSQPKLLVIDIAQTPANWVFGGAYSDFVRAVKDLDSEIDKVDGLSVLLSADEGQVSWIADERRMTAFGFYFAEGVRGAAGTPGGAVTALTLTHYLRSEVQKWAVANRGANQEPVLLPAFSGGERAEKMKLATLPTTPYTPPAAPEAAIPTPPELHTEWKRASDIASRIPAPDTTDPIKWREYLEWLMRWDRLLRVNAVPDTLPPRVKRLGNELETRPADDVVCGPVALPAGAALSGTEDLLPTETFFNKLWDPPGGSDHATEWAKLLKDVDARKENTLRTAVARFVIEKVLVEGVSVVSLETADSVLKAVGGVQPVEAHFVRMLHLHLPPDPKQRPSAEVLRTAVALRRTAEEAAWADGLAYPEQATRWSLPLVEAADELRQSGEDLLFDTDPKSHAEAAGLFEKARKGYAEAKGRAQVVADALAQRDKVFARLPYYARWVASPRGGPKDAEELTRKLELAASGAHKIDKIVRDGPLVAPDSNVNYLDQAANGPAGAISLDAVAAAYNLAAKDPGGQVQDSNWHALEAAQVVPFRTLGLGPDLAERARKIAVSLATASQNQQPAGTRVNDPDPLAPAARNLRAAAAYLDDPSLARSSGLGEKPVKLADQLAERLREIVEKAHTSTTVADTRDLLRDAASDLAEGNRLARLSDPAAPVGGEPTPPEADRRFWRHYMLLAHAERITKDGWCSDNPAEKNLASWYCSRAAQLVFTSAEIELHRLVPSLPNLPPARQDRLTKDLTQERDRKPTALDLVFAPTRVIVPDERGLRYTYEATVLQGERIGFPVAEYELPEALVKANSTAVQRRLERRLANAGRGSLVPQATTFVYPEKYLDDKGRDDVDTLSATLRYRGRVYRADTTLTFAGKPDLRIENVPPTGNAVMALQAEADAVNGAVTILIDRTQSMNFPFDGPQDKKRSYQARVGVRELIRRIPAGTQLTIGGFYGKDKEIVCEVIRDPSRLIEPQREGEELFKKLEKQAEPVSGTHTPLAGALRQVLNPVTGKTFWPANFTGERTLIVVTDGADTWYDDGNPGYTLGEKSVVNGEQWRVVEAGLKEAEKDKKSFGVGVHLVLFGMTATEEKAVKDQFENLESLHEKDPELLNARFRLVPKVKDGADFARQLAAAVMPRVRYRSDRTTGVMVASLKSEPVYNPTEALDPVSYRLTDGVNTLPDLQLDAGERVLVRAVRRQNRLVLTRPPIAYELAQAGNFKNKSKGLLAITLPEVRYERTTPRSRIEAVVTLEELDPAQATDLLKAPSRLFAWFDLANPDGSKFDVKDGPQVSIRNHLEAPGLKVGGGEGHELLAPAWDVKVNNWDSPGTDPRNYRRPQITAYWLNGLPDPLNGQHITAGQVRTASPDALPLKAFESGPVRVPVLDAAVTERNKQLFLTVWMDYQQADEMVWLHVKGDWKAGKVGESHTYYAKHHRYTAEFGPFTQEDLVTPLTLELYSVNALRRFATDRDRVVTLDGDAKSTDHRTLPPQLFLNPQE